MSRTRWGTIAHDLEEQIQSGRWEPGARLPSEDTLSRMYGVSRMTIRQALSSLEANRRVIRVHGSGTYVPDESVIRRRGNALGSFHEELGLSEDEVETKVVAVEVGPPPSWVASRMLMTDTQMASRFDRVRLVRRRVISFQRAWVPLLVDPGLSREQLSAGSLYKTLRERRSITITRAEQEVTASAATEELAATLGCPAGAPLIDVTRISFAADGRPVIAAHSWTLPDFSLVYELNR